MEKEICIKGKKLTYAESGTPEGHTVILLHGWGCSHTTVRSIAACLEESLRVISVDLPGHGKSEEPDFVMGTKDFADIIFSLADQLRLKDFSLIGHSFGGRTSISMATNDKEGRIRKIVLVDSAGITPKRSLKYYYKVYTYKICKKLALALLGAEKGSRMIEKMIGKRGSADYQSSSPMMRSVMSRCINEDLRKDMPNINVPVLLIWGENDTATPVGDAKIMERQIKDSGLVVFPGCGHYSFLDNPIGFKAVLREFFKPELSHRATN